MRKKTSILLSRRPPGRAVLAAMIVPAAAALGATAPEASKLPPPAGGTIDFTRDIKPILEQSCLRCHGPEKPKSRFRLDNRDDALKGGENGVAIIPGRSAESPLIQMVAGTVADMQMPPKGKGDPLTPGQIGLLRAWIDQNVAWETVTPPPVLDFAMSPIFGWTTVDGDKQKFREHRWRRDGWDGGIEQFDVRERLGKDTRAVVDGHAMLDDYKLSLTLEKRDLGFARLGVSEFRKYFDDSGGYHPGFNPSLFSPKQDLHLDLGRTWAEIGLTLPDWPRLVLGYEHQYRDGNKSTLQWGAVTDGLETKNIYPSAKRVDEQVHVLRLDFDYEIKGYRFDNSFRGEFVDLKTARRNTRDHTVGSAGPSRLDAIRERADYFHGANALRMEKPIADWWLASAGYLFSHLDSDAKFSLDSLFPLGTPGFADRWRSHALVLERETHAFNATSLFGPWQNLTLTAGILSEWTRQEGFGRANLDLIFPPTFNLTNLVPVTIDSSYDRALVEESAALRFAGIPFTTVFAEARLQQDSVGENEQQQGGAYEFLRDTDASSDLRDWRAGFGTSPWRKMSLSSHYRRYEKETDFDDSRDLSTSGASYPAFIRWRKVTTDEVEARLSTQLASWVKTVLSYRFVSSEYQAATDLVSVFGPGDVSVGGRLESANQEANIYSLNATFTQWRRLYLNGTFSYQDTSVTVFDNGSPSVAPYRGDVFSVLAGARFAVSTGTQLAANYSFSWADYGQENFADGLPVGLFYRQHGVMASLSRRLTSSLSTRLQYGFYLYDEPSRGGRNDYTAHAVFATLNMQWP